MNDHVKLARWRIAVVDAVALLCGVPIKIDGIPFGAELQTPTETDEPLAEVFSKPSVSSG